MERFDRLDRALKHKKAELLNPGLDQLERILEFEVMTSNRIAPQVLTGMTQKAKEHKIKTRDYITQHKAQKARLEERYKDFLGEDVDDSPEKFAEFVATLSPQQSRAP